MSISKRLTWDARFMKDAYEWAWQSKDPRTKVGAVIVYWDSKDPIAHGYNGLPKGVNDKLEERWVKPLKDEWASHAEHNAICLCARSGRATEGATMFTQGLPCMRCCNTIVNAGIKELVIHRQWVEEEKKINFDLWQARWTNSFTKLTEAGVEMRWFDEVLGVEGVLDGKLIKV